MTARLSPALRVLTLLFSCVQIALPALVAVGDGGAARSSDSAGVHVEATGGSDCTPPHSADCAICRHLTTLARGAGDHSDFAGIPLRSAMLSVDTGLPASTLGRLPQSRAPPSV